jgi:4-hydroxybenzoyl-CoA thioesterase/acyl-CoA thioester hydrolase
MQNFTTKRKIEFADTDMGGIVHFSRFFVFMETAEHEFLNALGTSASLELEGRKIGWPRVTASCEYRHPARFGDVLDIHLRVARKGLKSISYEFKFARHGRDLATGKMTSVCCELDHPSQELRPVPIPPIIADMVAEE